MTQQLEFKNLKELMLHLSDEESAAGTWRYCRNGEPFCPHCNATKPHKLKDGKTYRCNAE